MVSKIEQIIDEIEELIDSCKYAAFSSTKILVDKEEIDELLHELKTHTPDEIMRCQKIISNKEAIMEDATTRADAIVKEAQAFSDQMVSQHEIMQQAYAQAGEIVNQAKLQAEEILTGANIQAQNIQSSAMQYTDDSLSDIQQILMASIRETQEKNNNLVNSLSEILNIVSSNRAELHPEEELARNAAIAERAETERRLMGEEIPEEYPRYGAPERPETVEEKKTEVPVSPSPSTVQEDPKDAPAPKAMGGVIRGGISKSIKPE